MIISVAAFTTACSDDDDTFKINTVDATVQFNKTSVSVKESATYIDLPIEVIGLNRDGFIKVSAALKSNPSDFDLDSEVVITSYSFLVPADRQSVNLEVSLHVATLEMDRGRNVSFEITGVEGAALGAKTTCTLNIIEKNGAEGLYEVKGVNPFDNEIATSTYLFSSDDESFDHIYIDRGIGGKARVIFTQIVADAEYNIAIEPFQNIGKQVIKGKTYEVYLSWGKYDKDSKKFVLDKEAPIKGRFVRTIKDNKETVKVTLNDGFGFGYYNDDHEFQWFPYECFNSGSVMTKIQ